LLNTIVIAYRKDQLPQAPKRWVDFWDPKYRGKFALYSINNSASFMFIMNTARLFGKDPKNLDVAFQKIRELRPFKQSDFGGDMENLLARNEVQIGLIDGGAVTRLRDQGIPMDLNVPLDGIYTFEQDTNVTEFSKNKDVAFEFVNFMLARDVQEMWARGFYTTPGNRFVKWDRKLELAIPIRTAPHIRQIIWWDWDWLNGGARETMIQRWNREIIGP
jgi:putative spermidine/putrescine transport system substrate-binding protein